MKKNVGQHKNAILECSETETEPDQIEYTHYTQAQNKMSTKQSSIIIIRCDTRCHFGARLPNYFWANHI